jgi:hypothetical protein
MHAKIGDKQMSHFHFEIKSGKRGSTLPHLSYISRIGVYAKRNDLVATANGNLPDWSGQNPEIFFKASDKYERKNGSTFRDLTISLPSVLTPNQNVDLARDLVEALAPSKPFLFAVHNPISSLEGELNPHVHAMICDRLPDGIERTPEDTFRRHNEAHPELGGCKKDSGGMSPVQLRHKVLAQRKIAADTINVALAKYGHTERVDHRSLHEQGKRKTPERYLGPARIRGMSTEDKQSYISARHAERSPDRNETRA